MEATVQSVQETQAVEKFRQDSDKVSEIQEYHDIADRPETAQDHGRSMDDAGGHRQVTRARCCRKA